VGNQSGLQIKRLSWKREKKKSLKKDLNLDWVPKAHACNPNNLGGWDQGGSRFKARHNKNLMSPPISTNRWTWWCTVAILAMVGKVKYEDQGPGQPEQKVRPYFKNNQSQKSWRHGSSGREPAKQVQSPEFKPQYHKKKKT
jgi:hypothetical protein